MNTLTSLSVCSTSRSTLVLCLNDVNWSLLTLYVYNMHKYKQETQLSIHLGYFSKWSTCSSNDFTYYMSKHNNNYLLYVLLRPLRLTFPSFHSFPINWVFPDNILSHLDSSLSTFFIFILTVSTVIFLHTDLISSFHPSYLNNTCSVWVPGAQQRRYTRVKRSQINNAI